MQRGNLNSTVKIRFGCVFLISFLISIACGAQDVTEAAQTDAAPATAAVATAAAGAQAAEQGLTASVNEVWTFLRYVWEFELYSSGGVSVRLNQLLVAILIFIIGAFVSKRTTAIIGSRLAAMDRLKPGVTFMVQRILFYLLLVIVTLIALPIAGIPITIFTVLGGALAIGVGFGAQNLFNNLISGIIIMLEQPIRVGDIVELGDQEGRVEDIGNRCVRVRRTDGVDVIVPNSHFLEQQVVNWTLFDSEVRGSVTVGIAYGSDTRKAARIIEEIANAHPRISSKAGSVKVLFEDFGDSSLVFNLLFWTRVSRPMDLREMQSELRYRIDEEFRKADIVIAFPQRDVHLNLEQPVNVRIMEK